MKKIISVATAIGIAVSLFCASEPKADAQYVCYYCCFANGSCVMPYGGACGYACYCNGVVGVGTAC